jgi:hypothetical protein
MPHINPAVQRCASAYHQTYSIEKSKGVEHFDAEQAAHASYISTMPDLADHDTIRDFIACVTYAMLHRIIREPHASKLLFAAKVALSAVRSRPKPSKSDAA